MILEPDSQPSALFFIPTLAAGGAERVCVQYLNDLKTFRPILMLQFRRGELLAELNAATPLLVINAYTGYSARGGARRRRLHHAIRRRRRILQVRLKHLTRKLQSWRQALRRRRRILKVRLRYLERRVRTDMQERYGKRTVWFLQETERVVNFIGRSLRFIAKPIVVIFLILGNIIRGLLSLIAAPFRLALGLPAFPARAFAWGMPTGSLVPAIGPVFAARFRFVSDCLFLVRQARLLTKAADAKHCDIIVSFLPFTNVISILSKILFDQHRKVVINVHSVKTDILQDAPSYDQHLLKFLIRKLYGKADRIIAVAEGIKQDLVENFGIPESKIQVIHNPIDVTRICRLARQEVDHPWIKQKKAPLVVAVGRLVRVKGFDLLIHAFAELPDQLDTRLMIIGDGPERAALQHLAKRLGLEQRVTFVGFQQNPWKFMKRADCLALSSRTEGLPMVIGEALALELPVIATDCSHGVREYLEESRYGMIVPPNDASALAEGIRELLRNEELRLAFVRRASDRVQLFARGRIVEIFESALREVVQT